MAQRVQVILDYKVGNLKEEFRGGQTMALRMLCKENFIITQPLGPTLILLTFWAKLGCFC